MTVMIIIDDYVYDNDDVNEDRAVCDLARFCTCIIIILSKHHATMAVKIIIIKLQ